MRNVIGTILGRKGMGKSYLVREILAEFDRVLILDTMGEYGTRDGVAVASTFSESLAALEEAGQADTFKISMRVIEERHAEAIADVVYAFRNVLFVVEEASVYMKPQALPDPFKQLVLRGRHHAISQLYVAQRAARLHRDITSQSDYVVAFQQHGSTDIKYLEDVFGDQAEQLRTLAPRAVMVGGPSPQLAPKAVKARIRRKDVAERRPTLREDS